MNNQIEACETHIEMMSFYGQSVINIACDLLQITKGDDVCGNEEQCKEINEYIEEYYKGEYNSASDYAKDVVKECGFLDDVPKNIAMYFNYEAMGRDMLLSGEIGQYENRYFFTNY